MSFQWHVNEPRLPLLRSIARQSSRSYAIIFANTSTGWALGPGARDRIQALI